MRVALSPPFRSLTSWSRIHRWSSLACTVFLLILCATGLPLIFKAEIGDWTGTTIEPPAMPADTPHVSVDRLVADAKARRPGDAIRYISQDDDAPAWFISMGRQADSAEATAVFKYDARTGAMIHDIPQQQGVMYVIREAHVELFSGLPGTLFIGAMGCLFVLSIVSGIVIYAPFMRKLRFGEIRQQRGRRIRWLDLHNLLAIATASWLLVVGVTGIVNTLALPLLSYWQRTALAEMTMAWRDKPAPVSYSSLQQAIAVAKAAAPGMDVSFVGFPGSRFATPHHYMVFMRGDTVLTSRLLKPVMIDAETDQLVAARSLPWYLTLLLISQPLHFGDYGGLPLKILWAGLDLIAIVVLGSGIYLWFSRRSALAVDVGS